MSEEQSRREKLDECDHLAIFEERFCPTCRKDLSDEMEIEWQSLLRVARVFIRLLKENNLRGDYGTEIAEELSATLDIGLDTAREIIEALKAVEDFI